MKKKNWKKEIKRGMALLIASNILITMVASSSFAVDSYYSPDGIIGDLAELKEQTWSDILEDNAKKLGLTPTGLSQQQSALMGGYTTKFWFQNEKSRTAEVIRNGKTYEVDFSDFNHRYYSCADSHSTGWFAPVGSQLVFKELYYPTTNVNDYPQFIRNNSGDIDTMKFTLLLISMLSSAYDTPSLGELKDSDKTSMYYYLLWLSIWANDIYAANGQFHGVSQEADWDYVQAMVRRGYADKLNPDVWGSAAVYDAFRDGGPAEKYFFHCWKAVRFLASLDFNAEIGTSLPVTAPVQGDDGMYHMTFDYSSLSAYEKEVYRRLEADNLQDGWEYINDGSLIDFKSTTGQSNGTTIAVLRLQENSEEDHFNNCGFGMGGLAGFQGCAIGGDGKAKWGNTQIYFSAVAEPLEILVNGSSGGEQEGEWSVHVDRYEHEEKWETNYNVRLRKYDSETGQPLSGSKWDVLEAFDASQLTDTELESPDNWANRSGSQFKKWDGWDYGDGNPDGDVVNDPCPWDMNVTNEDGLLMLGDNDGNASGQTAHMDKKQYTYHKGYCGGHPEPEIETSGDPEIDADLEIQAHEAWEAEVETCEALAEAGGFCHSIDVGAGKAELEADRDSCYRQFVSLRYKYSVKELDPRPGYTVHGSHTDDIPVEVKTVTSSEYKDFEGNGKNLIDQTPKQNGSRLTVVSTPSTVVRVSNVRVDRHSQDRKDEEKGEEITDTASPSDASVSDATRSNAVRKTLLARLRELFENPRSLWNRNYGVRKLAVSGEGEESETGFVEFQKSEVESLRQGRGDLVDHTFIIYDHRTEGEVHMNKRDFYLHRDGNGVYDSYGDSQGDGTLEGAVYGLFALGNIAHPDGHSGTVFEKDNLVAVATTDRNGDASFMAITEAPGSSYDYKTGKIVKRSGGFDGPDNLHKNRTSADTVKDMENYIGNDSAGQTVSLTDSTGDGNIYQKLSSNQTGVEGLEGANVSYPISNNEALNGNCWIGRPLIVEENGTSYYIKELNRSEGYELSVSGKSNAMTNGKDNYNQGSVSDHVEIGKITTDNEKNANYFEIRGEKIGHDITLKGLNFPEGAVFELSTVKTVPDRIQVPVYTVMQKPVQAAAGTYVYRDGKRVEASVGDSVLFPGGQSYTVQAVSEKEDKTIGIRPMNYHTMGLPAVTDLNSQGKAAAFKHLYNGELEVLGYKAPGKDAPWVRVHLQGTTDTEWIAAIAKAIKDNNLLYFNSLRITDIEQDGGELFAVMRYEWNLYGDRRDDSIYVPDKDMLYVKKDSGNGYFVYAVYEDPASNPAVLSVAWTDGFLTRAVIKDQNVTGFTASYPAALPDSFTLFTEQTLSYWVYSAGEQGINDGGDLKYTEETKVEYVGQDGVKPVEKTVKLDTAYDEEEKTYTVPIPVGAFETTDTVSLKVSDDGSGKYGIRTAYINGSYLACLPPDQVEDSYVVNVLLTKPAAYVPIQDGGTRKKAAEVLNRPIKQKIRIVKDILADDNGNYQNNTIYLPNFRFKLYQKSNLERLYRAEDGTVAWQDRNGNTVDVSAYKGKFPEKVQKLYTQVSHETDPLTRNTNLAAGANVKLYDFTDGLINGDQNSGYTRILETTSQVQDGFHGADRTVERYEYEKFFDAVKTANCDKWDRKEPGDTTGSDHIRQFAITWYLDDEVKKLVRLNQASETESSIGGEDYQDEIYDTALTAARKKAENYLEPFFIYDMDQIYAIEWDSENGGGKDKDRTTLSADVEDAMAEYCYGVSEYLPYGTYVAVEQQPFNKKLNDLYNKHYEVDVPKEIDLPSVYDGGKTGAEKTTEVLNPYYNYSAHEAASDLASRYFIRFNGEWPEETGDDFRKYVIRAHGCYGDYEIYKYGLDLNKLNGTAVGDPSGEGHFTITQSAMDPMKDYYNTIVNTEEKGGNPGSHYLADDKNRGIKAPNGTEYETDAIEKIYHYGSVSENKQTYDNVVFPRDKKAVYQDQVRAMEGVQTAYDGRYASMLVPWTVTESADELTGMAADASGESDYQGYAWRKYRNTLYSGNLRIEKLDSETGENILHDGAVFALYGAEREDGQDTDGLVKFYNQETMIKGSRQFLEAMGAIKITPAARALIDIGNMYTGYVPVGTPVCSEARQIILSDHMGRRTGAFEAFTTTRDGLQADEEDLTQSSYQDQNSGYLVTPQPLGAGTYVLCEMNPPAGYVRTKPIAIEIYSDKVSYYLDGNKDDRVTAAIYADAAGERNREVLDTARIRVGNTPVRLEVSKVKDKNQTVTDRTDTRLEGSLLELIAKYGKENLEFAYKNGKYLGYAWYKGTLEYLESRKAAGEAVEIVSIDGVFAGYGLITRTSDMADDANRYTAGAKMALYDAIAIKRNGDRGDYGYDGLEITRDRNSNVQSMKVLKGYAGESVKFVNRDNPEGSLAGETGEGNWTYEAVLRKDTDILFYSMADLKVTEAGTHGEIYGYDRDGHRVLVKNQTSIYAIKNGRPLFEIIGGNLEKIRYSALDKYFPAVNPETVIYHLDGEENRDAMVEPETGMAYVIEKTVNPDGKAAEKILVWPVEIARTKEGAVIARDKIRTYRIATVSSDTGQEYTIGTYDGQSLRKTMNPVIDRHGLPEYYQKSGETYQKGNPIYDIDGDYVRYKYDEFLPAFNNNAYRINEKTGMEEIGDEENVTDDGKLWHRKGEAWIMENTWVTGERYPNDPFKGEMTAGQADMLKRVIPGIYIMEEQKAPDGYAKSLPVGITVGETNRVQNTEMVDKKIRVEIVKTDAVDQYKMTVDSDYQDGLSATEPKGAYSYGQIIGAHLALYKAKRIYTTDTEKYPKGYYLEKTGNKTADWITDGTPKYFEGISAGDYILEELDAADGYIRRSLELEIKATEAIQAINLKNDHTKLEVYKYYRNEDGNRVPLPNSHAAGLALYEARTDENGNIIVMDGMAQYDEVKPVEEWTTDDLTEYIVNGALNKKGSFLTVFEDGWQSGGREFVYLSWETKEGKNFANRTSISQTVPGGGVVETWKTGDGKLIRIMIYRDLKNGSFDETGNLPWKFEYQFNYKELAGGAKSYDTLEGMHRIDYLAFNAVKDGARVGNYVLVETKVPDGYEEVDPKAVVLTEKGDVQRYSLENIEKYLNILKVITDGIAEYAAKGVRLTLYHADGAGKFTDEQSNLVESWVSGQDGTYTDQDKFDGKIPDGFTVGELKPHRINQLPYGVYYVDETEILPYMAKGDPVRVEVGAGTFSVVRIRNTPTKGRLVIRKTGADTGEALKNARFLVTNRDTKEKWYVTTGNDGLAELAGLPVGVVETDGTVSPYTYAVEEISPPDRYQISGGKKFFRFDGSDSSAMVSYIHEVEDHPSEIHFKKTNFDTGMAVEGAKIAVYHAVVVEDEYQKDGEAIETVISGPAGFTMIKKLSAGQTYIMEEMEAPAGMHQSSPVMFTVNQMGSGIQNIHDDFSVLKLEGAGGTVESLTVIGRMANEVSIVLEDLETGEILPGIIGSTDRVLTAEDGLEDGHLYGITEYTNYSDGKLVMSSRETKRIHFDENGTYTLKLRTYVRTRMELTDQDGMVLDTWDENSYDVPLKGILIPGGDYRLTEITVYSDGEVQTSGIYRFTINESGHLDNVDMEDKPVSLYFSKTDIDTGEEIAGGHYSVTDVKTGEMIYEYDKEERKPVKIPAGQLKPGREYSFRENLPPAGYACEEEIRFTVNENGIPETVVMQDKKTRVFLEKTDADTGEALIGGHYKVRNPETGETVFAFTSDGHRVLITGILTAGMTYEFVEVTPPDGYTYSRAVEFTVPEEPEDITVTMKDKKTEILVEKLTEGSSGASPSDAGAQLPEFRLQILNKDKTPAKAIKDFGSIRAGGELVFTTTEEFTLISGQLTAGAGYWLHEIKPRDGYSFAKDVPFTVAVEEGKGIVVMKDKPTHVILSKRKLTGREELPGNHMAVTDEDGKVIETWVSGDKPHEIIAELTAGKTYYLCETAPKKGYAGAKKVLFVVSLDGQIDQVEMRNEVTRVRIRKIDSGGHVLYGAVLQILDAGGQVVIPDFLSSKSPVLISGMLEAGVPYYLHEVKAPSGYLISGDVPFTVPKGAEAVEVVMVDPRKENPEPENPEPEERKLRLMKTDAETGKLLSGFTFTIFLPGGRELASAVTGDDGYAVFDMPADGTYRFRETAAAEGYLLSDADYTFTVQYGRVAEGSTVAVADQRIPSKEVKIGKITAEYRPKSGYKVKMVSGGRIRGRKTGDETPLGILFIVCIGGIIGYFILRRKGKRK